MRTTIQLLAGLVLLTVLAMFLLSFGIAGVIGLYWHGPTFVASAQTVAQHGSDSSDAGHGWLIILTASALAVPIMWSLRIYRDRQVWNELKSLGDRS